MLPQRSPTGFRRCTRLWPNRQAREWQTSSICASVVQGIGLKSHRTTPLSHLFLGGCVGHRLRVTAFVTSVFMFAFVFAHALVFAYVLLVFWLLGTAQGRERLKGRATEVAAMRTCVTEIEQRACDWRFWLAHEHCINTQVILTCTSQRMMY